MYKPYIIHIVGIQGSGKSYICKKLKHIPCIDTDKILFNTFSKLLKNKTFRNYLKIPDKNSPENIPEKASNILFKQAKKTLQNKINKIHLNFFSILLLLKNIFFILYLMFFLKISKDRFGKT